ncbi:MAG: insulinase family protein [Chloroflexi bacterium]|nr:insulinase family protein [Chloroflexota bacterium]
MRTQVFRLPNSLRVITAELPGTQAASIAIYVGTGSRYEHRRLNGVSHYIEHMLFKGTRRRPDAMLISEAIEGAGGRMNAFTGKETTCYVAKVPFEKSALAMEVLADMLNESLFDPDEFERERKVIQEEIKRSQDSPAAWAGELLVQSVYGDQPMGWDIAGTVEIVGQVTREDLLDYMAAWYVPNNMVVAVAGNIRSDEVVALCEQYFGDRPAGELGTYTPVGPRVGADPVIVETRSITQANLGIAARSVSRQDPDRWGLSMLSSVLGRGMSSRLFKEVRERRGLAYSVGCGAARYYDTGLFSAHAGVAGEKVVETAQVIMDEFRKLLAEPVTEEELAKVREYSVGDFRLGLEDSMAVARWLGEHLMTLHEVPEVEEVVQRLRGVTPQEIQQVAQRIFVPGGFSVAVTGPHDHTEELRQVIHAI